MGDVTGRTAGDGCAADSKMGHSKASVAGLSSLALGYSITYTPNVNAFGGIFWAPIMQAIMDSQASKFVDRLKDQALSQFTDIFSDGADREVAAEARIADAEIADKHRRYNDEVIRATKPAVASCSVNGQFVGTEASDDLALQTAQSSEASSAHARLHQTSPIRNIVTSMDKRTEEVSNNEDLVPQSLIQPAQYEKGSDADARAKHFVARVTNPDGFAETTAIPTTGARSSAPDIARSLTLACRKAVADLPFHEAHAFRQSTSELPSMAQRLEVLVEGLYADPEIRARYDQEMHNVPLIKNIVKLSAVNNRMQFYSLVRAEQKLLIQATLLLDKMRSA